MSDLRKYLNKQLQNSEFKAEHERTKAEYEVVRFLIAARIEENMTQQQLAERSGIRQSNISRIENGTCSPTIATLESLARGLNKRLVISLE